MTKRRMQTSPEKGKQGKVCFAETDVYSQCARADFISKCLKECSMNLQSKQDELCAVVLEKCIRFDNPAIEAIDRAFEAASAICDFILKDAAYDEEMQQKIPQTQIVPYDPDKNFEKRRRERIEENLKRHFKIHSSLYAVLAGTVSTLVRQSSQSAAVGTFFQLVDKCKQASIENSDSTSPKPAEDKTALIRLDDSIFEREYQDYLNWAGSWRTARPREFHSPKHNALLASVISWLLNFQVKSITPSANPLFNPTPLKIAIFGPPLSGKSTLAKRLAKLYQLELIELHDLYNKYLEAYHRSKVDGVIHPLIRDINDFSHIISRATFKPLSDDVNVQLVLNFITVKQDCVRGFVLDGFPSSLEATIRLRNALDGFDCDKVLASYRRETSTLFGDALKPQPPSLPRHLLDLVIHISVPAEVSYRRLREMRYRETVKDEAILNDVEHYELEDRAVSDLELRLLEWTKECLEDNVTTINKLAKSSIALDGSRPLDDAVARVESAMAPIIKDRLDEIVKGDDSQLFHKPPTGGDGVAKETTVTSRNDEQPFELHLVGMDLEREIPHSEIQSEFDRLTVSLAETVPEEPPTQFELDRDRALARVNSFEDATAEYRMFVTGESAVTERPPTPAHKHHPKQSSKGDKSKNKPDKKEVDPVGKKKADTARQPSAAVRQPDGVADVAHSHYQRGSDSTNPVVQEFSKFKQTGGSVDHESRTESPMTDSDEQLEHVEDCVERSSLMRQFESDPAATECDIRTFEAFLDTKVALIARIKQLDFEKEKKILRRQQALEKFGSSYTNGFPILNFAEDATDPGVYTTSVQAQVTVPIETSAVDHHTEVTLDGGKKGDAHVGNTDEILSTHPDKLKEPLKFDVVQLFRHLSEHWKSHEARHSTSSKHIFAQVHLIRLDVASQVSSLRSVYFDHIDWHSLHFQPILFEWQSKFNSIEAVRRTKVPMKEVLHGQICDFNKQLMDDVHLMRQKALQLHDELLKNGWLEDRIATVVNYATSLIQVELDLFIDAINLLRDFVSITELKMLGSQTTLIAPLPYIEIAGIEIDPNAPMQSAQSPMDGRRGKPGDTEQSAKASNNHALTIRPLGTEPVAPTFVSRRTFVPDFANRAESVSSMKRSQLKLDRKSHASEMSAVRKHSKTQASANGRHELEENMLQEFVERAKDAVTRLRDAEEELRNLKFNIKLPDEGKKTGQAKLAPVDKGQGVKAAPSVFMVDPSVITTKSGYSTALEESAVYTSLRLETIRNHAHNTIANFRKAAYSLSHDIVQNIDLNFKREMDSLSVLIEYLHCQVESEEPLHRALMFHEHQFVLSTDFWLPVQTNRIEISTPVLEKDTVHKQLKRLGQKDDLYLSEDMQKFFLSAVEKRFGQEYVDSRWFQLEQDDLYAAAKYYFKPPIGNDGVPNTEIRLPGTKLNRILSEPPKFDWR